jgi:AraC family transcriptional regulator of adaptative response/methylated-DNA-[protein]-cysteine methyltransferase
MAPAPRPRPSQAEEDAATVIAACRLIDGVEREPSLAALASAVGLSPRQLQRIFLAQTGLSPKGWAQARRAERLQAALSASPTITEAAIVAGFSSTGRFYETTSQELSMTPSEWKKGGEGAVIRFAVGASTLGAVLVGATPRGICAILLGDDPVALVQDLEERFPKAQLVAGDEAFEGQVAAAVGLVEAPALGLALPLDLQGTAFQRRVWQALREIPAGKTASYAEVAERLGAPTASRAVAGACAANPGAIAVPCHRVVRQDGGLSGYRWGIDRKRALLEREQA